MSVSFSGSAFNKPFKNVEVSGLTALCQELKIEPNKIRCWVSDGDGFWMEVNTKKPSMLDKLFDRVTRDNLNKKEHQVIFRNRKEHSPNSSPHVTDPLAKDGPVLVRRMSSLALDAPNQYRPGLQINRLCPFTREEISSLDPADLIFFEPDLNSSASTSFVAVDRDSLEGYIKMECQTGKNLDQIVIRAVETNKKEVVDGKEQWATRDIMLKHTVWMIITKQSQVLRHMWCDVSVAQCARVEVLKELQGSDLGNRVRYWIADLMTFSGAEDRLSEFGEGYPPFMTPFYFNKKEAEFISQVPVDSGYLGDKLTEMVRTKATAGEVCTSHDLAPLLQRSLDVQKNFHKDAGFKKAKAAWEKKRAKELKKQRK